MQGLITFFEDLGYMAHGMCLLWEPWLIALFAGSDFLTFTAYAIIPMALLRVLRARKDLANRGVAYLFAAFILLCGLTHLVAIFTLWVPAYTIQGVIKLVTGLVSLATAAVLFPLVPRFIALPSAAALREANARLTAEVTAHEATLDALRRSRDRMEDRVAERTRALERSKEEISLVLRQSANRGRNLSKLVQALARQTAAQTEGQSDFLELFQDRIAAVVEASDALTRDDGALPDGMQTLAETQLGVYVAAYPGRVTISGEAYSLTPTAARQIGLALNELATNAVKHGALRDPGGKVAVHWSRYRDWPDGGERFQLNWLESLPPGSRPLETLLTSQPAAPLGYGSRVLNISVPQRLKGRAEEDFAEDGMSYTLDVPADCLGCRVAEFCAPDAPTPEGCARLEDGMAEWAACAPAVAAVDRRQRSA